jgi:hypothetical protein
MTDIITALAESVTAVVSVIGLVFIIIQTRHFLKQLKESNKITRVSNIEFLFRAVENFNMKAAQDRDVAKLWYKGVTDYAESFDEIDKYRFRQLWYWVLNLFDHILYQYEQELLDKATFDSWWGEFERVVEKRGVFHVWDNDFKESLSDNIVGKVEIILNRLDKKRLEIESTESKTEKTTNLESVAHVANSNVAK